MRLRLQTAVVAGALALAACGDDPLDIGNPNNPAVDALLGSASGTETLIGRNFQTAFIGQYGASDAIWPQSMVLSGESEATVANFGMLARGGLPRAAINNAPGNSEAAGNLRDYSFNIRVARQAALTLQSVDRYSATWGTANTARNRAFAFFTLGYVLGHTAMIYDSASVITQATAADDNPAMSPSAAVAAAAIRMLDSASFHATSQAASGSSVPASWMSTPTAISIADFNRLVRSYRARIRASVARTPEENAQVDWAAVRDDALNGIQRDIIINAAATTGWPLTWINQAAVGASWHQVPNWYIGMADTTGAYATWLNAANSSKAPFLIRTPDARFPRGETRAAQNAFQGERTPANPLVYFRNRPAGQDASGGPTGGSQYDLFRFYSYRDNNSSGQWVLFAQAENDLLAAEGAIRTGQLAVALPLIDRSRVRAGLPALTGVVASLDAPVPGGNACVPRTPVRSGGNYTLQCGNALEALKYEKRIETSFTGYSAVYFDARRWGDLISGTPLEWPVPFQEANARNVPVPRNTRVAASTNTYGWNF